MYAEPPGYTGQPPPLPSEAGLYPQPGAVGSYNQPQQPAPPYPPPPPPPSYAAAAQQPMVTTQHTFVQQPPVQQTIIQQPVATVATVQPTVVIQQQRRKPENYMVFAVLVTFFCNPVFGIIAWIFACLSDNAFNEGNEVEARKHGRVAMWLSIVGIITAVIFIIAIPAALVGGVSHVTN